MEGGGRVPFHKMTEPEALLFKMRWWLQRFDSEQAKPKPDLALMEKALDKAAEAAIAAAPYHHARLSAMMVSSAAINKIEISGGLPDDQDGAWTKAPIVAAERAISSTPDAPKAIADGGQ
jgi:hypothetical protein